MFNLLGGGSWFLNCSMKSVNSMNKLNWSLPTIKMAQ